MPNEQTDVSIVSLPVPWGVPGVMIITVWLENTMLRLSSGKVWTTLPMVEIQVLFAFERLCVCDVLGAPVLGR